MDETSICYTIILCTATLAVSFYAGCVRIAGVIGSFTINIVNDSAETEAENISDKTKTINS